MKRFEVIQGGKDGSTKERLPLPEIMIQYSAGRRAAAVLMMLITLAALIYWSIYVFPNANVKKEIGLFGLVVLIGSLAVSLVSTLSRLGTGVVLTAETVKAQIVGVFGAKKFEIPYSSIASVGYAGQGVAPDILITDDTKKKSRLPGLLFKDRPALVEVLQDRVVSFRKAIAEQIEFPRRFSYLWQAWISAGSMLIAGSGILAFNLLTNRQNFVELGLAGALLSMTAALAVLGVAPFATYSCEGRVIRRRAWLRPDLSRSIDLRDVKRFSMTPGPQRRLQLFDDRGHLLMAFEISAYDFSSLVFWAERALERN